MIEFVLILLIILVLYLAIGEDVARALRPQIQGYKAKYSRYLTRPVVLPGLVFAVLGILMRDIVLTPFLLLIAGGVVYLRIRQLIATAERLTPRQISQLVLAFRGAYELQPAVFKSLEEAAKKVGEPLRSLVDIAVETYFTTSSSERAFAEFRRRTKNPMLNQFIYILEMSESARDESVTAALDNLIARLRRQEDLQRQVETGLASITGQTSFIQGLAIAIAYVVAILPGFRRVYTANLLGRLLYIAIFSVILVTSYYIEKRVRELKERQL